MNKLSENVGAYESFKKTVLFQTAWVVLAEPILNASSAVLKK